jgi:hypothetical protein
VFSDNQPAYWDSTCLVPAFPCWKYPGEIAVRVHLSLPRDFLGRRLSESSEMHLCGYTTPHSFVRLFKISHFITIVSCLMIFKKKKWYWHFRIISMLLFPLHLACLQILRPIFYSLIWGPTNTPSLILSSLVLEHILFKYINPALFWSIAFTKFCMGPSLMCNGGK